MENYNFFVYCHLDKLNFLNLSFFLCPASIAYTVVKVRRKYRCTPVWCETKPVYAGKLTDIGIPTITSILGIIFGNFTAAYRFNYRELHFLGCYIIEIRNLYRYAAVKLPKMITQIRLSPVFSA